MIRCPKCGKWGFLFHDWLTNMFRCEHCMAPLGKMPGKMMMLVPEQSYHSANSHYDYGIKEKETSDVRPDETSG